LVKHVLIDVNEWHSFHSCDSVEWMTGWSLCVVVPLVQVQPLFINFWCRRNLMIVKCHPHPNKKLSYCGATVQFTVSVEMLSTALQV